jgi:hypothetical protein
VEADLTFRIEKMNGQHWRGSMSLWKTMALSAALLIPNVAWAQESLADLAQKDPNATLNRATLWISAATDQKDHKPQFSLFVFSKKQKIKLASLERGAACAGNCRIEAGDGSAVPVSVDAPEATYQESQGFESYFFIEPGVADGKLDIDSLKVELQFSNGASLVSYTKVNRSLVPPDSADDLRDIRTGELNAQNRNERSIITWDQRPNF